MLELSKLESLALNLETMDEFHDAYCRALAEAVVSGDRERIKQLRVLLYKEFAFVALEMVKAKREECGTEEIVQ